jgi:O-antigen ligase
MAITVRKEMPGLFWAIVALVVLLPLPLGAVYQWSWGLMACVVGVVLAVWSARVALGLQDAGFGLRSVWPLAVLFGIAIAWTILQAQSITPSAWHHPLWATAASVLGSETGSAISLNPFDTLSGLVRLLAYGGIFWISLQYCRRAARARQVLLAVVYGGLAYALYGIIVYLTGSEGILFSHRAADLDGLTGTFIERNSFAIHAGLALVCCTALLFVLLAQASGPTTSLRDRASRLVETAMRRGRPLLLAWFMLSLTLVLSQSRIGFLSTLLGLLSFSVLAGLTRAIDRRLTFGFGALAAAGLICVLWIGGDCVLAWLSGTSLPADERALVYDRLLAAINDAGALGTGFGTFEEAFRFYRTSDMHGNFDVAHNTYLENVLELGVPAALALFGIFAFFLVLCAVGIRQRRRDAVYPCIGFAATILAAAHALSDFSLQIPAVMATYMLIMGAACAQCWSSRRPADPW